MVGANDWLPPVSSTYHFGVPGTVIGCNQLHCSDCGEKVRAEQGWKALPEVQLSPEKLFETVDWSAVEGLKSGSHTLYVCRCQIRLVDQARPVQGKPDAQLNWRCKGHPPFRLPGEVDGRMLHDADEIAEYVDDILAGTWKYSLPNPIHKGYPGFLLWRLYAKVRDLGLARLVSERVLDALTHPKPIVRAVAIAFFRVFPDAPEARQLALIYRQNPELFKGVRDPIRGQRNLDLLLEWALQERVARTYDPEALAIVRENLIGNAPMNEWRFRLLQENDRVWLENHRDQLLSASPGLIHNWVYMIRAWPEDILFMELEAIGRMTSLSNDDLKQAVQHQLEAYPRKLDWIQARL